MGWYWPTDTTVVTFELFFFDADLDGFEDLFVVNGHVVDETRLRHVPRAQPPQLFRNLSTGRFAETVPPAGSGLDQLLVGRGAAYTDYNGDGDLSRTLPSTLYSLSSPLWLRTHRTAVTLPQRRYITA